MRRGTPTYREAQAATQAKHEPKAAVQRGQHVLEGKEGLHRRIARGVGDLRIQKRLEAVFAHACAQMRASVGAHVCVSRFGVGMHSAKQQVGPAGADPRTCLDLSHAPIVWQPGDLVFEGSCHAKVAAPAAAGSPKQVRVLLCG